MRQFLSDLWKGLRGIWQRLDGSQRVVVGAVATAVAVGLGAMLWFAGQPNYVSVLDPKTGEEMREARRLLNQAGVATMPDETGQSILVDRVRLGAARSALIEGGLLSGGERPLLDSSIVEDSETKRFKIDAATRAQTQAAITALQGVQAATVAASRPRRSAFSDRDAETEPRATVALRLRSGASFEAVARSAASIASSQLMVEMANVDVVNAGNPQQRWRFDPDRESGGGSSEFLALQRAMADERTEAAQQALEAIHPGKTLVTVSVELDPLWETTMERVVPSAELVASDSKTTDSTVNTQPVASGGDPSISAAATERSTTGSTTKKETRDRKFVTDIGEKRSGRLAPAIKRLSVALLYDRSLEQKAGFEKDSLLNVVKSIVGWDAQRDGDASFSSMAGEFAAPEPEAEAAGPSALAIALQWAPTAGQVLGVVLVLLFLRSLLKTPSRRGAAAPATAAAAEDDLPPEEQQKRMRREIERAIAGDPAALARLLENWLSEQKAS